MSASNRSGAHRMISAEAVEININVHPSGTMLSWTCGAESGSVTGTDLKDLFKRFGEMAPRIFEMYDFIEVVVPFENS